MLGKDLILPFCCLLFWRSFAPCFLSWCFILWMKTFSWQYALTPLSYSFVCSLQGFPYGYHEAYIKYPIFITFNFKLGTTSTAYKNFILLLLSPSHFKLLVLCFLFFYCVSSNKLLQLWLFLIHLFFNIQTRAVNYIQPLQY